MGRSMFHVQLHFVPFIFFLWMQIYMCVKSFHFAQHAKSPVNMAELSYYVAPKSSNHHIQNLFRGQCYATDLKSLSQGSRPPTTSITWTSHSAVLTEVWSERGYIASTYHFLLCEHRALGEGLLTAENLGWSGWAWRERRTNRKRKAGGDFRKICAFTRHFDSSVTLCQLLFDCTQWHLVKRESV